MHPRDVRDAGSMSPKPRSQMVPDAGGCVQVGTTCSKGAAGWNLAWAVPKDPAFVHGANPLPSESWGASWQRSFRSLNTSFSMDTLKDHLLHLLLW